MIPCPKCERKRNIFCKLEKQAGVSYWIGRCIECHTPLTLEPFDKGKPFIMERCKCQKCNPSNLWRT